MTEFTSCLSSLVFGRTRAGGSFLFQESLNTCDIRVWEHFQNELDENQGFLEPRELPAKLLEYASEFSSIINGKTIVECGTGIQAN